MSVQASHSAGGRGSCEDPTIHCDAESPGCITCGDVALALRVLAIDAKRELALCADRDGRRETVEIALVAPVELGERLLVHAGTAIARAAADTEAGR